MMGESFEKSDGRGGSWKEIWCGVLVVLVGVFFFFPGRRGAGPAAKGIQTLNRLKNVGLAGANFESDRGEMVLEDKNEHGVVVSWGTQLLPYLDEKELFSRVNQTKSWDDEGNREVFGEVVRGYFDETQPLELMRVGGRTLAEPVAPEGVQVVVPGAAVGGGVVDPVGVGGEVGLGAISFSVNVHVLGPGGVRRSEEITDGLSQTILFGTIRPPFPAWGKPGNFRDPGLGLNRDPRGFGADHPKGVPVLFADGSVRVMDSKTDVAVMRGLGTPRGD
ncbi:DUF1559 family PulG-like putative transporter [Lacunimicrobium album]